MVERKFTKKFLAKVTILGDVNVGKTTLIQKFTNVDKMSATTITADFSQKKITLDGVELILHIWDTAGQERHTSIGYAFYRGSNCCILTFDLSNQASFERLAFWKKNFLDQASPANAATFPFIVVGNKTDTERVVTREAAEEWCRANGGYSYHETCATSGDGVEQMFMTSGTKALADVKGREDADMPASLSGAAGALKIDRKTEIEAEEQQKKNKKKCKC